MLPVVPSFQTSPVPRIIFGSGCFQQLAAQIAGVGRSVLIITGARSFIDSARWVALLQQLQSLDVQHSLVRVKAEPSPSLVDAVVREYRGQSVDLVVAIGGGSALDAGKAIAGLLPAGNPVMDYLEGVGRGLSYSGSPLPFIAVPTTAGTGSEMTRNAVLSDCAPNGFKKSFRHDALVADLALVDPDFLRDCPRGQLVANAMDAFTQLLESFVSSAAQPLSDALALDGMRHFMRGFSVDSEADLGGHAALAYASMMSGISLAQAGLGAVHGLASSLGGQFPIPHGVACGTLLAATTEANIVALEARDPRGPGAGRYARAGELICDIGVSDAQSAARARRALVDRLWRWTEKLDLPRLGNFAIGDADLPGLVADCRGGSMKTNPIELTDDELSALLRRRL